jgi:predicted nucleic acid-binding protein
MIDPNEVVFLDTSYAIALSAPADQFHERALALATELEQLQTRFVTTRAVMMEIGNALSRERYREAAVRLLSAIETDPRFDIVPLSDDLFGRAFELFRSRPDKECGLIDCASFVTMSDRSILKSLTTDEHFAQAGFFPLLRRETST